MKPIRFSRHARMRMADPARGPISEDEVRVVLSNPGATYTGIDGKLNALGEVAGKSLRVCYAEDSDGIVVITVINRRA